MVRIFITVNPRVLSSTLVLLWCWTLEAFDRTRRQPPHLWRPLQKLASNGMKEREAQPSRGRSALMA